LVAHETLASSSSFTPASIKRLDELYQDHWVKFHAVSHYRHCLKPKHYLRANYPVDIDETGPLIYTWCMSFEALLQVLKNIARHSNYKNVCARLARVWAIHYGLMLYGDALEKWIEATVQLAAEPLLLTFQRGMVTGVEERRRSFTSLSAFEAQVSNSALRACAPGPARLRACYRTRYAHATARATRMLPHALRACYAHATDARGVLCF
jgi:hypothetical protein